MFRVDLDKTPSLGIDKQPISDEDISLIHKIFRGRLIGLSALFAVFLFFVNIPVISYVGGQMNSPDIIHQIAVSVVCSLLGVSLFSRLFMKTMELYRLSMDNEYVCIIKSKVLERTYLFSRQWAEMTFSKPRIFLCMQGFACSVLKYNDFVSLKYCAGTGVITEFKINGLSGRSGKVLLRALGEYLVFFRMIIAALLISGIIYRLVMHLPGR